jgi:hypothetical protein
MLNEESDDEPTPRSIQHSTFNIQHSPSYWLRLYALVIGELAVTILIFYLFTRLFA